MAQFEFIAWLAKWLLQQADFEFDWDHGNSTKSVRKHGIKVEGAEQVFRNKECLIPLGIQISPVVDEPRFGALGMDLAGNKLSVCFTIRSGKVRVISIRPMSSAERRMYGSLREE